MVENETTVNIASDLMIWDLTLSIDNDDWRLLGCQELTPKSVTLSSSLKMVEDADEVCVTPSSLWQQS